MPYFRLQTIIEAQLITGVSFWCTYWLDCTCIKMISEPFGCSFLLDGTVVFDCACAYLLCGIRHESLLLVLHFRQMSSTTITKNIGGKE